MPPQDPTQARCWNCWERGHDQDGCPERMLSPREQNILRKELGVALPEPHREYLEYVGEVCFNCWGTKSKEHELCDQPERSVEEREQLRCRRRLPLSPTWRMILKENGYRPLDEEISDDESEPDSERDDPEPKGSSSSAPAVMISDGSEDEHGSQRDNLKPKGFTANTPAEKVTGLVSTGPKVSGASPNPVTVPSPTLPHPKDDDGTEAVHRCWNCWEEGHETKNCPHPRLPIPELERLRLKNNIPIPVPTAAYNAFLNNYPCFNCWKTTDHWEGDCPEPHRDMRSREMLRFISHKPLPAAWREKLARHGHQPMGKKTTTAPADYNASTVIRGLDMRGWEKRKVVNDPFKDQVDQEMWPAVETHGRGATRPKVEPIVVPAIQLSGPVSTTAPAVPEKKKGALTEEEIIAKALDNNGFVAPHLRGRLSAQALDMLDKIRAGEKSDSSGIGGDSMVGIGTKDKMKQGNVGAVGCKELKKPTAKLGSGQPVSNLLFGGGGGEQVVLKSENKNKKQPPKEEELIIIESPPSYFPDRAGTPTPSNFKTFSSTQGKHHHQIPQQSLSSASNIISPASFTTSLTSPKKGPSQKHKNEPQLLVKQTHFLGQPSNTLISPLESQTGDQVQQRNLDASSKISVNSKVSFDSGTSTSTVKMPIWRNNNNDHQDSTPALDRGGVDSGFHLIDFGCDDTGSRSQSSTGGSNLKSLGGLEFQASEATKARVAALFGIQEANPTFEATQPRISTHKAQEAAERLRRKYDAGAAITKQDLDAVTGLNQVKQEKPKSSLGSIPDPEREIIGPRTQSSDSAAVTDMESDTPHPAMLHLHGYVDSVGGVSTREGPTQTRDHGPAPRPWQTIIRPAQVMGSEIGPTPADRLLNRLDPLHGLRPQRSQQPEREVATVSSSSDMQVTTGNNGRRPPQHPLGRGDTEEYDELRALIESMESLRQSQHEVNTSILGMISDLQRRMTAAEDRINTIQMAENFHEIMDDVFNRINALEERLPASRRRHRSNSRPREIEGIEGYNSAFYHGTNDNTYGGNNNNHGNQARGARFRGSRHIADPVAEERELRAEGRDRRADAMGNGIAMGRRPRRHGR